MLFSELPSEVKVALLDYATKAAQVNALADALDAAIRERDAASETLNVRGLDGDAMCACMAFLHP